MAASNKGRNTKKTAKPRSATATEIAGRERAPEAPASNRQLLATVLFATAAFVLFVVLIKGQNVWAALHNFIFGVFGIGAFVFPFLLGYVAVLCAMDKSDRQIRGKLIQTSCLILLFCATIDIFLRSATSKLGFVDSAALSYANGMELSGGGVLGCMIGYPLISIFGKAGATITILILLFVFFMLVTGTPLIALLRTVSKPAKKTAERVEQAVGDLNDRRMERAAQRESERARAAKFNVDVALDDEEEQRNAKRRRLEKAEREPNLREMEQKVYDSYHGIDREEAAEKEKSGKRAKRKKAENPAEEIVSAIDGVAEDIFHKPAVAEEAHAAAEAAAQDAAAETKSDSMEGFSVPETSTITVGDEDAYRLPPISLLQQPDAERTADISAELKATATKLVDTLRSFGVETRIVDISRGPAVTRYELQPAAGVKISKITNLADDIALNLASAGVRIEAPIPNKSAVGIEVPNKASSVVRLREILESSAFANAKSKLTVALGRDISGNAIVTDIAKMPHGLIAGATGSGKSVCINSIIMSLLFNTDPDEVKLLMVDPKMVELGIYNGIPHLLVPVVTDPRKASGALGWAVTEMEKRYKLFAENNVRNLAGYNHLADLDDSITRMSQIVIIIDELADLMMTAPREVEDSIQRLTQKARAAGMHLIVATQRPSVDVITGTIKNNIPTRIAFAVSSTVDSRTILDMSGAERLMGRGDMLFHPVGFPKPVRVQGCFVEDDEVEAVVDFIKNGQTNEYDEEVMEEIERQAVAEKSGKPNGNEEESEFDPMLEQAIEVVVEAGQASTSLLQRRLKLGYARAARIVDQMEQRGVVGPYEGSKPRQVLISKQQLLEMQSRSAE